MGMTPYNAFAQTTVGDLQVSFSSGAALFSEVQIAPGFSAVEELTVTNTGTDTEFVYTSATNTRSSGLADGMDLAMSASSTDTLYFSDTFANWFATGTVALGKLSPGASRTYTLTATFPDTRNNTYQGTTLDFDLLIGFASGESVTVSGAGGSSGGTRITPAPPLPPGEVAGAATRTEPTVPRTATVREWIGAASDWINGVRGASATSSDAGNGSTTDAQRSGNGDRTEGTGATTDRGESGTLPAECALIWLLVLGALPLLWSIREDWLYRASDALLPFFRGQFITSVIYAIAIAIAYATGLVVAFSPFFFGAVLVNISASYILHHPITTMAAVQNHSLYYLASGVALALLGLFSPLMCVVWPFATLAIIAAVHTIFLALRDL